jgi:hypothetical protein
METSMAVTRAGDASRIGGVPIARRWLIAYWVVTLYVALTSLGAGVIDILHAPPLFGLLLHLGYPPHFATILGVWKVLGAVALLAPRYPLLKEWAYAGMFFDLSSAVIAHASAADGVVSYIAPLISIGALIASWYLRPQSRRVAETYTRA